MASLQKIKSKITNAEGLHSVVNTMKSLAAVSVRQYGEAEESLREYYKTVEMGLQIAIMTKPEKYSLSVENKSARKYGIIIFGSEQGMCGQFDEKITEFLLNKIKEYTIKVENINIIALGRRIVPHLEEEDLRVNKIINYSESIENLVPVISEILTNIDVWRNNEQINRIILMYNRQLSGMQYEPYQQYLLPADASWINKLKKNKWESNNVPTYFIEWDKLFSQLIREYIFVSLYRAFAESLASENYSRLALMQTAEKNIQEYLEELYSQFHHDRQSVITSELLDIIGGFEALSKTK